MTLKRTLLIGLYVALPVVVVGLVSDALHSALVWPGCALSAFSASVIANSWAYRWGRTDAARSRAGAR